MGKKAKVGKKRRDKFYHLAKETGYRARSAFKLIQLNRKFHFLQQSRVLIDLCAAPGGWLQVASNHMPVSSIVIGVDLVKIKPIHNVVTVQADITTPKCRQLLQKELKTWKADCVLNDGAPNVGSAWLQDAFTQSELTLSALKLASEFLKPGGTFITKVFRSRDYQSLMNSFQQLFNRVHATKPQASRTESAEIFVVCQGYKLTKKPDPKLLDPKYVFEDLEPTDKPTLTLQNIQKPPKSALGYDDSQHSLFRSSSVLDFITADNHMNILGNIHKLVFDKASDVFAKHPGTTSEIKEYCQDIKVLGLRELKMLIKWRESMKQFVDGIEDSDNEKEQDGGDKEEMELGEVDKRIEELEKEEKAELKNALKRQRKTKKKLLERVQSQKDTHCEVSELISDNSNSKTFSLKSIKSRKQLDELDGGVVYSDSDEEILEPELPVDPLLPSDNESDNELVDENDDEEPLEWESDVGSSPSDDEEEENMSEDDNPLLVKLNDKKNKSKKSDDWFNNSAFKGLIAEEDVDMELATALKEYKRRGKKDKKSKKDFEPIETKEGKESSDDERPTRRKVSTVSGGGFEIVPEEPPRKVRKLDPEGLAIGAVMVSSKKKRMELIESGYNRWSNNDDDVLPDWFMDDENKHCQKQLPITTEMVEDYRKKLKEINDRPIKKVAEAKARKKNRALKKLESVRKRAQVICDTAEVTDHEKAHQIKSMYKKAGLLSQKKQEVTYVVAKKGAGKRVRRPQGVTGRFKVVDPRMKKDLRSTKDQQKKGKGKRMNGRKPSRR